MGRFVLDFSEIDQTQTAVAGGKGANLGVVSRIEGINVPPGFCVTTAAFERIMTEASPVGEQVERLARLNPDDRDAIREQSAEIRGFLEHISIPDDLAVAINEALTRIGKGVSYAVRSSATTEDSPVTSFAGQQDTFLNVIGPATVLEHIKRCWASLYSERAVIYRLRNNLDQRSVRMAVVVQQMVFPDASGVMFTADPTTGNRTITTIEAIYGLGEALVSGLVNADRYQLQGGTIVNEAIAVKPFELNATPAGGLEQRTIVSGEPEQPVLTSGQLIELEQIGRRIEARFGQPQDIEWCLSDDRIQIVQSRPITTLFPVPDVGDGERHVYLSVGHQQMMTDAMKPLGISVWQLTAGRPMFAAGGRLFVDVTQALTTSVGRAGLLGMAGASDPLTGDALQSIIGRDFIPLSTEPPSAGTPVGERPEPLAADPDLVTELIRFGQRSIATLERDILGRSGTDLLDFIQTDIQSELKRNLFDPQSTQVIMSGMEATQWLNAQLQAWLGEKNAADALTRSASHNITSEMGLALLDVADVIRPFPEIVAYLEQVGNDDSYLEALPRFNGGHAAKSAIEHWLETYGMRCAGEIDITRPRWIEHPSMIVPTILGNIRSFEPGEGTRRFEQGQVEARETERDLLERLRELAHGNQKAEQTRQMIDRVRTFAGYREYPKYSMISRYAIYKRAMLAEAIRLVDDGVIDDPEDLYYLTFQEVRDVVRTRHVDRELIRQRRDAHLVHQSLTPPRMLTSDGEMISGNYRRDDLPIGALAGLPVSSGTIEGRARVILDMADADLEEGDILVTTFTDPSWTPLFVAISGLVTEVGGVMTHGSVIAREYGLPAVVGVKEATRLIADGDRIRVHGTEGYVEILT